MSGTLQIYGIEKELKTIRQFITPERLKELKNGGAIRSMKYPQQKSGCTRSCLLLSGIFIGIWETC